MAHELSKSLITNEYRMAYRRRSNKDIPWHDKWTHCKYWTQDPDIPTVLHDVEAYINIQKRPVFDQDGNIIPEIQETWRPHCDVMGNPITDCNGNVRGQRLGIVGPQYNIFQDHELINWFRPWVENNFVSIETAGALFNGTKFWVLAKIKKDPLEVVKDDIISPFILGYNGHDGKTSFKVLPTDIRVICNNTANIALKKDLAKGYSVRHNSNLHNNLDSIKEDIEVVYQLSQQNVEKFKYLAKHHVKDEMLLKSYFQKVLREKEDPDKEIRADGKRPLHILMRLFEEGIGNDLPNVKGTWWAAYNSATEFVTHLRGRNSDLRLDNMVSNLGHQMISRALDIGMQMAANQ